jgi:hypothetical protein
MVKYGIIDTVFDYCSKCLNKEGFKYLFLVMDCYFIRESLISSYSFNSANSPDFYPPK